MRNSNFFSVKHILSHLKDELENNIPYVESDIVELSKPSMMGDTGLYYHLETQSSGVAVFFWDSGIFEISTDIIDLEKEDNLFFSYVPGSGQEDKYPQQSITLFIEKIKELLLIFKEKYPDIRAENILA
jgi:hypothetical protein